jgi:hypothetical protein
LETDSDWRGTCRAVRQAEAQIGEWLAVWSSRQKSEPSSKNWSRSIISYHEYRDTCSTGSDGHFRHLGDVPIEPLFGLLRHPRFYCFRTPPSPRSRDQYRESKDYMFSAWLSEVQPAPLPPARAYFFDLGASIYSQGLGGASQKWFVEGYAQRGIAFDRIFAWEPNQFPDSKIYGSAPSHVVDRLSYYNVGVDARPNAKHNPLRTLRAIATPRDFVVFKLDIDTAEVEEQLIMQILNDTNLSDRIDELYFEHHVWLHPLSRPHNGWGPSVANHTRCTVHDSYAVFKALRERGIRAHSWM